MTKMSPLARWLAAHPDVLQVTIAEFVSTTRVAVNYWRAGRYVPTSDHQQSLYAFTKAYGERDAITPAQWDVFAGRPVTTRRAA